ncbi:hypothetical protein [Methanohalophilus profundi]|uniref:hypothetical protein n=1 Tax=Methanohalophilus profundi TaxID=2138083 RepID=UPI001CDBE77F|nr:hypothetical protein [Methanohalophilus profundi]
MSTGTETYVDKDTKVYQDYENLYLRYLGAHSIVIMIEDEDIRSPEVLKAIDRLDQQISDIPGVVETLHIADAVKNANYIKTGNMVIPENQKDIVVPENGETELLLPDNTHTLFLYKHPEILLMLDSKKFCVKQKNPFCMQISHRRPLLWLQGKRHFQLK